MSGDASTGADHRPAPNAVSHPRFPWGCVPYVLGAFCLLFLALGPITPGIPPGKAWPNITMQQVRIISLAMSQYASDHNGDYPSGRSSTEVFQKLLDRKYVSDASLFYIPIKGKTAPIPGQPLKPENVCFDVTSPVDGSDPDDLPLVFSIGYKVSYESGASAMSMSPTSGYNSFWHESLQSGTFAPNDGIAIGYKNTNATFLDSPTNPNGRIPNFIPSDFKSNGKTYRQLTPNGALSGL